MTDKLEKVAAVSQENQDRSMEILAKLTEVAGPESVFSKPVKVGDTQVITASEVSVGLGFGFGFGGGPSLITNIEENKSSEEDTGLGSGGGGGGGAGGRPVAVISINENEVKVEPILDVTKISLAFFTMLGSVFFMGAQMRKKK